MIKKVLIVFLLIISTSSLFAQGTSSSPYSFFGIGEQYSPRTSENSAMGGIGVAFNHYKYLNFTNPAAIAFLRETTYSLGILNNDLTLKTADTKQNSVSTSLNYIALGFPLGKKAGFSLGLQPLSSVGYSLSNNDYDDENENLLATTLYSGEGGVNRVYGTFGIQISKQFAIGVELDYSFGAIENSITKQRVNVSLASKYKEESVIKGGAITLGTQYQKMFKSNMYLSAGATVKLGSDLNTTGNKYLYSLSGSGATDITRDTIYANEISGKYKLPMKSIIGFGLGKHDKWHVGVEYQNQDALQSEGFTNITNSSYNYEKSNRISLGGFYLPKINSISSYWERVTYRAGLRIEKIGLAVDGTGTGANFTSIDDFGMSFGLGLPLKQLSTVNLALEYGKRGTASNNLIEENYFNVRLSLSLTASGQQGWFRKRKID